LLEFVRSCAEYSGLFATSVRAEMIITVDETQIEVR
jgi:hypothetical protein